MAHAQTGGATILLADDDAIIRMSTEKALAHLGFEVLTAGDAAEAVEVFRRNAGRIRLVLLDVTMPRLSAEEAIAEIRRLRADTRVVLVTGSAGPEIIERFADHKVDGFLFKPFRFKVLQEKIREVLALEGR